MYILPLMGVELNGDWGDVMDVYYHLTENHDIQPFISAIILDKLLVKTCKGTWITAKFPC